MTESPYPLILRNRLLAGCATKLGKWTNKAPVPFDPSAPVFVWRTRRSYPVSPLRQLPRASRLNLPYISPSLDRSLNTGLDTQSVGPVQETNLMSGSDFFAQHFGLKERPFTLLPDPDFLFWSRAHKRAYAILEYGVMSRAPITIVTGEVGAGKTTLLQKLLQNFDETSLVGLISNAQGNRGELLQWVLNALDVPSDLDAPYVKKFQELQDFVIENYAAGRRVVLVIDEAQNLSVEGLEELRMLTNINSNKDELIQLILMGQPELREMITSPELRQFAQRVSASFHLNAMDAETTGGYIKHRLRHAGGTGEEFSLGAIDLIHISSGGVPRLVNKLADISMVYAVTAEQTYISRLTVQEVLNDNIFLEMTDSVRKAAE